MKTLWSTLSTKKPSNRKSPCVFDATLDADNIDQCSFSIELNGNCTQLDGEDILWLFTGFTCPCCAVRERELLGALDDADKAREDFYSAYPLLKAVEAGTDFRNVGRIELMLRNGDSLSIGIQVISEDETNQFKMLVEGLTKLGVLVCLHNSGCKSRRGNRNSTSSIEVEDGAAEEADRHMQELLEATQHESFAHEKASQRKKKQKSKAKMKKQLVRDWQGLDADDLDESNKVRNETSIDDLSISPVDLAAANQDPGIEKITSRTQEAQDNALDEANRDTDELVGLSAYSRVITEDEALIDVNADGPDKSNTVQNDTSTDDLSMSPIELAEAHQEPGIEKMTSITQDVQNNALDEPSCDTNKDVSLNADSRVVAEDTALYQVRNDTSTDDTNDLSMSPIQEVQDDVLDEASRDTDRCVDLSADCSIIAEDEASRKDYTGHQDEGSRKDYTGHQDGGNDTKRQTCDSSVYFFSPVERRRSGKRKRAAEMLASSNGISEEPLALETGFLNGCAVDCPGACTGGTGEARSCVPREISRGTQTLELIAPESHGSLIIEKITVGTQTDITPCSSVAGIQTDTEDAGEYKIDETLPSLTPMTILPVVARASCLLVPRDLPAKVLLSSGSGLYTQSSIRSTVEACYTPKHDSSVDAFSEMSTHLGEDFQCAWSSAQSAIHSSVEACYKPRHDSSMDAFSEVSTHLCEGFQCLWCGCEVDMDSADTDASFYPLLCSDC